ncbi:MAG: preprotein translocase subunit YajC [Bacteroidales bacterium]|nr:preprotein translocase subunit YajC [Bacteroidales bacterium]
MNLLNILLQAQQGGSGWQSMALMVGIIVVFYFFMIRPQMKKQKEIKKFRDNLDKGIEVITIGSLYGNIKEINDNIVTLEIAENVKVKVDKSAITQGPADLIGKK